MVSVLAGPRPSLGGVLTEPPNDVVELAGPVDRWERLDPTSDRVDVTWLTDDHAIKVVPIDRGDELDRAVANARWLGAHVSTSAVALRIDGDDGAWLVSERLPGVPAHRPDLHGDVGSLAEVAGVALRELHAVPVDAAPPTIERGWDALAALAEVTVAGGLAVIDEPYDRYTADRLLEMWRAGRPPTEDLVVCHGDPALPNLMANQGSFTGFVDLAGVRVADRHLDLAHAHVSVHRNLGPEAVYVFYDTYGLDPDLVSLDHYLLAKQLLP